MTHETLGIIWYVLLSVLWIGFVVLESLTSGVGMVFKSARSEREGRILQYTVGPYWDGSQVWFVTAAGATFAAFPLVYAEIFSNLYVALFIILIMLLVRGIAMELVYEDENPLWQKSMSWAWVISSYGVAFLFGVRFVNVFIKANTLTESINSFAHLLSKVGILGGLLFVCFYRTSGIIWANMKADDSVVRRLLNQLLPSAVVTALIVPILMMAFNWDTNIFATNFKDYPILWVLPVLAMLAPAGTLIFIFKKQYTKAFVTNILAIILYMTVGYTGIFPYMTPGVTVTDGMASFLSLKIMTGSTLVFLPLILGYQGWKFYHFRKKITGKFFD